MCIIVTESDICVTFYHKLITEEQTMAVLIISDGKSDLSSIIIQNTAVKLVTFDEAEHMDLSDYSALALLCGIGSERPRVLSAAVRMKTEAFAESSKPVFYEWCGSLGYTYTVGDDYSDGTDSTNDAMSRYVYSGDDNDMLQQGDLLDSQANKGCIYRFIPKDAKPILYSGGHILKHDHIDPSKTDISKVPTKLWRMWYYSENRLVCSFRISDFVKARFAPFESWLGILDIILKHLGVTSAKMPAPYYTLGSGGDVSNTFDKGMSWFDGCDILLDNGRAGVKEGLEHTISPDGVQTRRRNVRVDCVGEVAGAYFFDHLLNNNPLSFEIYKNLSSFVFEKMQVKSGRFSGMLRWTESAWQTVYADDSGRAIMSTLFYIMYTGDKTRLPEIETALDFLITVTGTDGLMHHGLCAIELTEEKIAELHTTPSNQYCAHRNAYYSAALLLAYRLNGKKLYLETAQKGLSTIMKVYPNTMRAISETEELSRLIFPLSCLYHVTGNAEHKKWLYDVASRLEIYAHKNGGYTEVDPGYTAYRSRTAGTESSMLADNGNEIAELLYSLNWLPLGFSYAYYVTKDEIFYKKWKNIADFMAKAQIVSDDKSIDGAWARCLDLRRMEIYGMPHDVGWGPCCIESGWTVGEILMGLGFGMAQEKNLLPIL